MLSLDFEKNIFLLQRPSQVKLEKKNTEQKKN